MNEQRTCVGCRVKAPKQTLVRLYKAEAGEIIFDPQGEGVGRGAYLCMKVDCVAQAIKKGGFARAFRAAVPYKDPRDLGRSLQEALLTCAERAQTKLRRADKILATLPQQEQPALVGDLKNWIRFADELETNLHTLSGKKPGKAPKETDSKTAP